MKILDLIGKENLVKGGVEAIIFGCIEIGLLMDNSSCKTHIFDRTVIHSQSAVDFAI